MVRNRPCRSKPLSLPLGNFLGRANHHQRSAARPPLPRPGHPTPGPTRRCGIHELHQRSLQANGALQRRTCAGRAMGGRHIAGRSRNTGSRWHHLRPVSHGPGFAGLPTRHGLSRRSWSQAGATKHPLARSGPLFSRSIRGPPFARSVAWPRPGHPAPMLCGMAPCGTM